MKDLLKMNIQIADSNNNVLLDCQSEQDKMIVNDNLQIVSFTDDVLQLKIKNYHIKSNVQFKGFPIGEPVENKNNVPKAMWNKLVKSGTAKMYNEMVEALNCTEWYSPDGGKTVWEQNVLAHNAAIMFLSTKFNTNVSKKEK